MCYGLGVLYEGMERASDCIGISKREGGRNELKELATTNSGWCFEEVLHTDEP